MFKLPKNINLILFVAASILSARFLYISWESYSIGSENNFTHFIMVFTNIGVALIFYYNYIQNLKENGKSLKTVRISKILSATLLIYTLLCFSIYHYMLIDRGFATGEILYEQIVGICLGVLLIILIFKYIKNKSLLI